MKFGILTILITFIFHPLSAQDQKSDLEILSSCGFKVKETKSDSASNRITYQLDKDLKYEKIVIEPMFQTSDEKIDSIIKANYQYDIILMSSKTYDNDIDQYNYVIQVSQGKPLMDRCAILKRKKQKYLVTYKTVLGNNPENLNRFDCFKLKFQKQK